MNRMLYSLLLTLTFATSTLPLTVNSTLFEHKESGKRILLLGDAHDQYIELMLGYCETLNPKLVQAVLSTLHTAKIQQKKALTAFAQSMLASSNKKASQTVVISEATNRALRDLCNNELDSTLEAETFYVLPQLFMNATLGSASKAQERAAIFANSLQSFGADNNSLVFDNQFRWVAGDTLRDTNQCLLLHLIKEVMAEDLTSFKASLPAHIAGISIGDVQQDIQLYLPLFAQLDVDDSDATAALRLIDETLKTGNVSGNTPIIDLTLQLQESDPAKAQALHSYLHRFSAHKFDLELLLYAKVFADDSALKYLIINGGFEHANFVKSKLLQDGYTVVETSGMNVFEADAFKQASPEQALPIISEAITQAKDQSPLALLPKLFQD
ncbi:hypothetical protein JST99_02265 [Candidatus Dependentiae bacterium]|nr:hypothetical protein [Candidatus Dependentiae bacterium]MCC7415030.1 hypothetical protein [Campylobacterota bacterium]